MSVSSCEVDGRRSSNGDDFCCTEEELFESFMEIVNDPELQEGASDQEEADVKQSSNALKTSASDDTSATQELNEKGEENEITGDHQSTKDQVENIAHSVNPNQATPPENVDNEAQNSLNDLNNVAEPAGENSPDMKSGNLDSQNIEKDHGENLKSNNSSEILTVGPNEEHASDVLKQNNQSSSEHQESNTQVNQSNTAVTSTQQSPEWNKAEVVSSILLRQPTSPRNESKAEGSTVVLPPSNRNEAEIVSSILLKQPTSPRKIKEEQLAFSQRKTDQSNETGPTDQREVEINQSKAKAEVSSSNEGKAEVSSTYEGEAEVSSTNQGEAEVSSTYEGEAEVSSTNEGEAEVSSTNKSEAEVSLTNQGEAEVSLTNQGGANVSSTIQSELQESIQEGIRKANQVCEELNALTQRMSQSSDELLGDSGSDSRKADRNSLRREPGVVSNGELTQNDDNLSSDLNSNTQIKDESRRVESQRPMSLPNLKVTNQSSPPISPNPLSSPKGTTPSPLQTTPSPSIESSTSPLAISLSSIAFLKEEERDRKSSMSDSLDSSEGSLGDTKSLGASPSPNHGPFNWDILNTALADNDTDDDACVYESSGGYGGFGLVLDDEPPVNELTTPDDTRQRSVSQSSTVSEAQFQEEYRKKHSTGSLDRNSDGVLCSGYLFKLGGTGITPKNWRKRWCVLRHDRCLYYYKNARDKLPCGIVVLSNYIVSHSTECHKKNCIKISKGGGRTYFFSSDTPRDMLRWMEALRKAAETNGEGTSFVIREEIIHNVAIPALSIKNPDCHGYLTKQGAKSVRSWKRRYCVLKNGCLYYYREMADTTALGVAKLHGYTVDEVSVSGRRNGFRCVPPHSGMRTFTFIADNEYDKKRWIPIFKESIRSNTPVDN